MVVSGPMYMYCVSLLVSLAMDDIPRWTVVVGDRVEDRWPRRHGASRSLCWGEALALLRLLPPCYTRCLAQCINPSYFVYLTFHNRMPQPHILAQSQLCCCEYPGLEGTTSARGHSRSDGRKMDRWNQYASMLCLPYFAISTCNHCNRHASSRSK